MVDLLVRSPSNKYLDALKAVKFDAGFGVYCPSEAIILKMHNIPLL